MVSNDETDYEEDVEAAFAVARRFLIERAKRI
jgi:hypothetical protein